MENMGLPTAASPADVFACTVGQKPSKAPFYVNDPADVVATLSKLAEGAAPAAAENLRERRDSERGGGKRERGRGDFSLFGEQ